MKMNFIKILLICLIVLITTTANAQSYKKELTISGALQPHESFVHRVPLKEGKTRIEAYATDGSIISCQFMDSNGNVLLDQKDTTYCVGNADISLPWYLSIKLTNSQNKMIDYRVDVLIAK